MCKMIISPGIHPTNNLQNQYFEKMKTFFQNLDPADC